SRQFEASFGLPSHRKQGRNPEHQALYILDDLRWPDGDRTNPNTHNLDLQRSRFMASLDLLVREVGLTVGVDIGPYTRVRIVAGWPYESRENRRCYVFPYLVAALVNALVNEPLVPYRCK